MTPSIESDDRCTPMLRSRIRTVFRRLPKALAGDTESIHQLRVAGRRLRVALPLLARKPQGRRVRRARRILVQLTRGAGGSRDLDVSLGLLTERLEELGHDTPELAILRRRLRDARRRSRSRMAEAVLDLEIAALRRDLRAIVSRHADRLFTVLLRFRQMKEKLGGRLLSETVDLGERFDPQALHRLRILCRRLRYLAEVGESLKGQPSEATAIFKELQERLGLIHDAHVLSHWLGRQAAAALARGHAALSSEAATQERWFVELSRSHHRDYLSHGPLELAKRGLDAMAGIRSAA